MSDLKIPEHVAIIMDGNGRWAKAKNRPVSFGHSKGVERVEEIIETADDIGIKYITFYAFSTENWKREMEEINHLFKLLKIFYLKKFAKLVNKNAVMRIIGSRDGVPDDINKLFDKMEDDSKNNTGLIVNIAFNYGGRQEIVEAVNQAIKTGKSTIEMDDISNNLYTSNQPDVDLLIRTSGEQRLSNFLIWQNSYSEFVFSKVLWPDFGSKEFIECIKEYTSRDRRFGGRNE